MQQREPISLNPYLDSTGCSTFVQKRAFGMIWNIVESTFGSMFAQASSCFSISPSDPRELPLETKSIIARGDWSIALRIAGAADFVSFAGVPDGRMHYIRTPQIRSTGKATRLLLDLA